MPVLLQVFFEAPVVNNSKLTQILY